MKNEKKEIERTKNLSIVEGSFSVLQNGFGTNNIVPYALAIGKNNPHLNAFIGFLSSFPSLLGNLSQIFTYKLLEKYSRKQVVSFFVFLQAMMWIGIIFSGAILLWLHVSSTISLTMLVVFYSLLIFFGSFSGPAWTSLMKDLVVFNKGAYFGKRNKITGFVSLVAF
jgi:MFS family permease